MSGSRQHHSSSPDKLYRPLPQFDDDVGDLPVPTQADVELDGENPESSSDDPIDSRIRWMYFVFGCATLLPWNSLITATPYFLSRLNGSPYQSTFASYLSSSFQAASFLSLIYSTVTSTQASPVRRIYASTVALAFLTLLLTLATFVRVPPRSFFSFTLMNCILQACAFSYLQPSVLVLSSLFGPRAIQAVMSGQGAVGVAVSSVQMLSAIASVWSTSPKMIAGDGVAEERSAFAFLGLATLFLVSTTGLLAWLTILPAYKAVVGPFDRRQQQIRSSNRSPSHERQGLVPRGRSRSSIALGGGLGQLWRVAKTNIIYEVAVAYVFTVTLSVFPPITIGIVSTNPNVHPLLFSSFHFVIFNAGDFIGRTLCAHPRIVIWSGKRLLTLSFAHTLFIPLFLMCNLQRSSTSPPPIINSDIIYLFIMLAFSFSNGYISCLCMMAAPSLEHNPRLKGRRDDVDVAATMATFSLVFGLAMGSIASFGVRSAICGCNPFKIV